MTEPPALAVEIGTLSFPGRESDAPLVAEAFRAGLARLLAADRAAGVGWNGTVDAISIDAVPGASPDAVGTALARAVRDRLVQP